MSIAISDNPQKKYRGNRLLATLNRKRRNSKGIKLKFSEDLFDRDKNKFGMFNKINNWNETILFQKYLRKIQKNKQPRNSLGQFAPFNRHYN